jgi:putative tryptophan/tyrosine transport system substrate-binding protein
MRRRDFITVLAGATAWMSAVRAEEPRHIIGFLSAFEPSKEIPGAGGLASFYQGLKETGFIEGKNISIESRWADGHYDRLPSLAAELVARKVRVIVADSVPSAFAAKAATKTIPIVFVSGADPVKLDLVESLSRPNSNLTGVSIFANALGPKDVELLHELLPAVSAIALLGNPNNANFQSAVLDVRAAADALRQHLEVLTASTESELEAVFATMVQHQVGALIVMADPFLIARRRQLVELAARHAMPAIYPSRMFADVGGLMSYGASVMDLHRQAGIYVGKLLKGAKTAELPIQQSTKVELVINLKTAKALGLIVPPQLPARADEVIE